MLDGFGKWTAAALIVALVWAGGCGAAEQDADVEPWPTGDASYDFGQPDAHFELADILKEISGLAVLEDGMLAAIQDEDGVLFILDPTSGEIVDERTFGPPGDYEALALGGGYLFVLESGGLLYRVEDWEGAELDAAKIALELPGRCDAEGLRYDAREERLLVSCKENPGPDLGGKKAIYAVDVDGRPVSRRPVYTIDTQAFAASVEDHPVNEAVRSVLSERVDLSGFKPSDLAFHPLTGELFVVSSARAALLSVRRDGTVTRVWSLPDSLLDQPEGMDFLPDGDLYVSSEAGDANDAVLLRFDYREPQRDSTE